MKSKKLAALLRSAASALEHGRQATATKKLVAVLTEVVPEIIVSVSGGVAEVVNQPAGIFIEVVDFDNLEADEERTLEGLSESAAKWALENK